MSIYSGIPLATLQEALAQAQAALPALERGEAVASVSTGDQRVAFVATTPEQLRRSIRDLQVAIRILQGEPDPRAKPAAFARWTR